MNWLEERQTRKALTRIACAGSARQYLMIKNPKACIVAMGLDMLKEISCAILRDADLLGADFSRADFSEADLLGVNLREADLSCAEN